MVFSGTVLDGAPSTPSREQTRTFRVTVGGPGASRPDELSTNLCSGTRVLDGPVPDAVRSGVDPPWVACAGRFTVTERIRVGIGRPCPHTSSK